MVMGLGQFLLFRSGRFSHFWFEFGFGKFPLKIPNFSILLFGSKNISLGRVKRYPGQRRVSLLFTASQRYMLGSGQGPSLNVIQLFYLDFLSHLIYFLVKHQSLLSETIYNEVFFSY